MSGRKIVLLDLDDTILDFGTAERKALSGALEELGIPADEALLRRYSEINRFCWQQLERGEMTRGELLVGRFERLFREKGIACPPELAQEKYEERLAMGHYFVPGAPELRVLIVKPEAGLSTGQVFSRCGVGEIQPTAEAARRLADLAPGRRLPVLF